jgi:hypothetical protein
LPRGALICLVGREPTLTAWLQRCESERAEVEAFQHTVQRNAFFFDVVARSCRIEFIRPTAAGPRWGFGAPFAPPTKSAHARSQRRRPRRQRHGVPRRIPALVGLAFSPGGFPIHELTQPHVVRRGSTQTKRQTSAKPPSVGQPASARASRNQGLIRLQGERDGIESVASAFARQTAQERRRERIEICPCS